MFTFISNIPIFRRLFFAFVLAAVIPGIIISILGATFINGLDTRSQAVLTNIKALNETTRLGSLLSSIDTLRTEAVTRQGFGNGAYNNLKNREQSFDSGSQNFQQNYQVATASTMSDVNTILNSDDPTDQFAQKQEDALNQILGAGGLWPKYKSAVDQVAQDLKVGAPIDTAKLDNDSFTADKAFAPLATAWNKATGIVQQISTIVAQVGPSQVNPIILGTVIAFLSTILVVIAIGYVVNQTITNPLRQLATLTKRIAAGNTNARAQIRGRDEIYMVANSMNYMLDNIVRLIQETQSQRDELQSQVEKLVSEVSGAAEGDLRVQAEVTADALGVLADSFNYMVEELGSLVVRVKVVAKEVDHATNSILDRMTQLVETGTIQISQITEAAIEVEHMAASNRQVAERSQVLYDVARDARHNAQGGREALQQTIEGMGRINENVLTTASRVQNLGDRSREIDEIVIGIGNIAHQTNRLALDAAIQAAMAGENGKGFGAVAADIRRLAERAKEQASSVAKIVRSVREDIGSVAVSMQDTERETLAGTQLTQEAGVALESIFTAVEQQAREIENINGMAMQQLQSSSAIVQIMHEVSESTQQSSVSTQDASQNMQRLARFVEQLRSSVEAFKLRENQGYFVPNTNISLNENQDQPMTVSGVFRTVSGAAQPAQLSAISRGSSLPPARSSDPFAFYSMAPNQQNGNRSNGGSNSGFNSGFDSGSGGELDSRFGNFGAQDQRWYDEAYNDSNDGSSISR